MDINRRIPHEGVTEDGLPDSLSVDDRTDDTEGHARVVPDEHGDEPGPESANVVEDTEGHVSLRSPDELTTNPGTGGDFAPRRPSTGGEFIDENDVEGHARLVPDDLTTNPGTGGDFAPRRPSTGGEFIDENDVEGHAV